MAQITIRVTSPRQLPKTVQTLRLLGLPLSTTTSPYRDNFYIIYIFYIILIPAD